MAIPGQEKPERYLILRDRLAGDQDQKLVPIWDDEVLNIGRHPQSNPRIGDGYNTLVSRKHCEVYVVVYDEFNSSVYVRDRNTRNGTFVNNVRIATGSGISPSHLLQDGDMIEIHPNWSMTFHDRKDFKSTSTTEIQDKECKLFQEKYTISQRCLGQGAEGAVYLASEVETRKQLVCKIVDLSKIKGKDAVDSIRRKLQEADVLRQLHHPNILRYVDAVVSPHSLHVNTARKSQVFNQLLTWLQIHIHRAGYRSEFEARVIIRQLVQALDFIHKKGVIHRDLKPENILLAYSPNVTCHRILLSDFGACAVPRRSRMLTHVGTTNYQAPEIQDKYEPHTASVDMWSLGIVTLTLITHGMDVSLKGLDRMAQPEIQQFLKDDALQPGYFSQHCEDFVIRCLQTRPSSRMTAAQARHHKWLCRPVKHLEHFRELERIARSNWTTSHKVRPMPLQLPDVTDEHFVPSEGRHLVGTRPKDTDENSQFFDRSARSDDAPLPPQNAADKSSWDPKCNSSVATIPPVQQSERKSERAVVDKRGLIIEQLRRANVKFLPEIPTRRATLSTVSTSDGRQKRQRRQ
ncbi:hypothetical protein L249_2991 [Ophiocordyceps polyrhachis-furcata BCC 54312]|uniref:Uncharacterized protein n=1 Tax=Ophiocordyceps polyrhachis-furcata BCC 54312 TaxID=1330021 RepID=A0A367LNJ6_9HYPO|nr:hypothetical protein L249_2991 [Ophiocordyceps polyrhachis-furcata BCC 54312]